MRIYISGKITETDITETRAKFKATQELIEKMGHEAINPFNIIDVPGLPWEAYMIAGMSWLFDCDAIFMLRGWKTSKGARIERAIAREMKMNIYYDIKNINHINKKS